MKTPTLFWAKKHISCIHKGGQI